jgi:hypothetical protein
LSSKARHQSGQVIERSGTFYIRYYCTEVEAGNQVRRRLSERLCEKDHVHSSRSCKAVRDLRDRFMVEVNKNSARVNPRHVPVSEFVDRDLPAVEEAKPAGVQRLRVREDIGIRRSARTSPEEHQAHEGSRLLTDPHKKPCRRTP